MLRKNGKTLEILVTTLELRRVHAEREAKRFIDTDVRRFNFWTVEAGRMREVLKQLEVFITDEGLWPEFLKSRFERNALFGDAYLHASDLAEWPVDPVKELNI